MRRNRQVTIEGERCRAVESMGYQHSLGGHAWLVMTEAGIGKVAVAPTRDGPWRFWGVEDRCAPLRDRKEAKP